MFTLASVFGVASNLTMPNVLAYLYIVVAQDELGNV